MHVRIITNPKSGRSRGGAAADAAAEVLRAAGWQVDVTPTSAPGQATELAHAAAANCDLVVACGGDGTLSEVVNGLRGLDRAVGFIPAGTGNDFASTVGVSHNPVMAARQILGGGPHPVDLLEFGDGTRAAINVIGVGFDAAVAARMNRSTRAAGRSCAYVGAIVMELARLSPARVTLRVDGQQWHGEVLLIALANAQSYGAGMRIAPHARVDDGLMDVVLVQPMGRVQLLCKLPQVFRGTHLELPQVLTWQAREVTIEGEGRLPVMIDGDLRTETPLHVRVAPGAVPFWLPDKPR